MTSRRFLRVSLIDRRWVALASGLLALWLQMLAPLAMAGLNPAASSIAGLTAAICRADDAASGKRLPVNQGLAHETCQICLTLQYIVAAVPPAIPTLIIRLAVIATPAARDHQPAMLRLASAAFSSRAPPLV